MSPSEHTSSAPSAAAVTAKKIGAVARVKLRTAEAFGLAVESVGIAGAAVGAPLAAFTGKLILALIIGAFGLGCLLRFVRLRRRNRVTAHQAPELKRWKAPAWLTPSVMAASVFEMAVLVEATRLPVRADQPGFTTDHWWWVIAGFGALVWMQRAWLTDLLREREQTRRPHP